MRKRGLTPMEITEHDFNLLFSGKINSSGGLSQPKSSFAFISKDFDSTTGKKEDARYLNERFKKLYSELNEKIKDSLPEFIKSYRSRIYNQGSKKYKEYIWLGFVNKELQGKPQDQVQFQVGINSNDPFSTDVFISRLAPKTRKIVKNNIENNKKLFLTQLHSLKGYVLGCNNDEKLEFNTEEVSDDDLKNFLNHITRGNANVYITQRTSKNEVIKKGQSISEHIIQSWKQMLSVYKLMAFGKIENDGVPELSYFILRTGGGGYSDKPDTKYNFKKGIPGYKQLLDAKGRAKFVYIEKDLFYAKGKIGTITSYEDTGTTFYDAQIDIYQKIEPAVDLKEVKNKISKTLTQAGITQISKEDYETIVSSLVSVISARISADLDMLIAELSFDDLLFEDEKELKSQIYAALMSGKHIMLIGAPGTGKTEIARKLGEIASKKNYIDTCVLTTATSDWTTFDTIGGYAPTKDGKSLEFMPGQFLRCFKENTVQRNRWLVIDEINRADIDKAFGQLFTVLSGQNVELPFTAGDKNIKIISQKNWTKGKDIETNEYVLPNSWRLIATLNTYDKASLYQMSYAFMRRFAFINIGVPSNSFIDNNWEVYLQKWKITRSADSDAVVEKIKEFWKSMNDSCRHLGPAIIKDVLEFLSKYKKPENNTVNDVMAVLISTFVLPQFEGLEEKELEELKAKLETFCNFSKIKCLFDEMFK